MAKTKDAPVAPQNDSATGMLGGQITEMLSPSDELEVCHLVREAAAARTPIYPLGGGTALGLGLPAKRAGLGLRTTRLAHVIDYPARDMTITVQAGITLAALQDTLAGESQQLPIDAPHADRATLGGLIASNHSGPLRYGHGTMRDHVIGIRAVDGRGESFAGGGRVVKNVAGYDFCKLLTGSLGTLGIITEVTLKLKPSAPASAWLWTTVQDEMAVEHLLAGMVMSETTPVAIEYVSGTAWQDLFGPTRHGAVVVALEGTTWEVDWMIEQLQREWKGTGLVSEVHVCRDQEGAEISHRLTHFSADEQAPLVLKITSVPSGIGRVLSAIREVDPQASIQVHAGNGITIAKLSEFPSQGLARTVIGKIAAAAAKSQGYATILSNPSGAEMTQRSCWGVSGVPLAVMDEVKRAFDPQQVLNPGRFVYSNDEPR